MGVGMYVIFLGLGLFGKGGQFDLFHEVANLLYLLIKLPCLLLCLLLERSDLVISLVPILIGIIGLLYYIRHLLSLLVQLRLEFLVEVIENDPLLPQGVDQQLRVLVDSYCLIELLISLVQSIL